MQSKDPRIDMAEKDYTDDEFEFIRAMEAYIKRTKHKFPSFTECLKVAKSLGYRKDHGT